MMVTRWGNAFIGIKTKICAHTGWWIWGSEVPWEHT